MKYPVFVLNHNEWLNEKLLIFISHIIYYNKYFQVFIIICTFRGIMSGESLLIVLRNYEFI